MALTDQEILDYAKKHGIEYYPKDETSVDKMKVFDLRNCRYNTGTIYDWYCSLFEKSVGHQYCANCHVLAQRGPDPSLRAYVEEQIAYRGR